MWECYDFHKFREILLLLAYFFNIKRKNKCLWLFQCDCVYACNGELHNFYSSPVIIRQIKSRRMRWAGLVACMGDGRNSTEF
jgi:hypothetical protein